MAGGCDNSQPSVRICRFNDANDFFPFCQNWQALGFVAGHCEWPPSAQPQEPEARVDLDRVPEHDQIAKKMFGIAPMPLSPFLVGSTPSNSYAALLVPSTVLSY